MRKFIAALAVGALALPTSVLAYRPFDGTDAAVADIGEVEIEFSPLTLGRGTWTAPAVKLNYGFAKNWEVVLEGEYEHPWRSRSALLGNALALKTVVREGSLQDVSGVSLATEAFLLLPGINDEDGVGAGWAAIASQRWQWGTLHLNLGVGLTRDSYGEIFFNTILEGPDSWLIRPVAEFSYGREFGADDEIALLIGAIWQASDTLAFDVALRQSQTGSRSETQVRMGLSFAFPLL